MKCDVLRKRGNVLRYWENRVSRVSRQVCMLGWHARGRGFESLRLHFITPCEIRGYFFVDLSSFRHRILFGTQLELCIGENRMSSHFVQATGAYVIRIRDVDGHNRSITVNEKNLRKYDQPIPSRITERVARKLEQAVLARETMASGSVRSSERRNLLWLDVVARYLPPLVDDAGRDTWQSRPLGARLENEKTYSHDQLDRMQRVLAVYFPAYLDQGRIGWRKNGKRNHDHTTKIYTCTRRFDSITQEDVSGFQIYLTRNGLAESTVRGYMASLKTFLSWCVARDYLVVSPAAGVQLPTQKRREVRWLEQDNAKKLLKAAKGRALEGPVRVILGLGLRRSEMINLEWDDVNFDASIVRVRGTKTNHALREVPLPKDLAKYFKMLEQCEEIPNVLYWFNVNWARGRFR